MEGSICLVLQGLHCSNCANKIEAKVRKLDSVGQADINFVNSEIRIAYKNVSKESIVEAVRQIVAVIEPDVSVFEKAAAHGHAHGHDHEHGHSHGHGHLKERDGKLKLAMFGFGILLYVSAFTLKQDVLFFAAYICFGFDVVMTAAKNILKGRIFDENFLMTVSTVGAFCIGEYPEAAAVMLFYQIGEILQDRAVDKSRKSVKDLMDISPEYANLVHEGEVKIVTPDAVHRGDVIMVKPGEKIPLDGVIIDGASRLDMKSLTGEALPVEVSTGEAVMSGSVNMSGLLKIEVTGDYENSTVRRILDLVENAAARKSKVERFITKFARIYTPAVVFAAVFLAIVPPLILPDATFSEWLRRALVFLVISCPCALVVSVPLTFFSGVGSASKKGILIKGSNYLQVLSEIDTVVMDKTGTLTQGDFHIVKAVSFTEEGTFLHKAHKAEKLSNHPLSRAVVKYCEDKGISEPVADMFEEIGGLGVRAVSGGAEILAGNRKLMLKNGVDVQECTEEGSVIYVAENRKLLGYMVAADKIKDDSYDAIRKLRELGVKRLIMLTGDKAQVAGKVSDALGLDGFFAELLPHEKVEILERLYAEKEGSKILFAGDGINDAPVLARADIGAAMGGVGSAAAVEAADIVLMTDQLSKIADAIQISANTLLIAKQNIIFALAVKFGVLALGAVGLANMWLAIFADVGVTLIVVVNSMRKK